MSLPLIQPSLDSAIYFTKLTLELRYKAKLQFDNDQPAIILNAGDYLLIPSHTKHRVHWTHPEKKTIWLAIHIYPVEINHA